LQSNFDLYVSQYGLIHPEMFVFVKPTLFVRSFCLNFLKLTVRVCTFRVKLPHLFYFSDMEKIGDKDTAIADRVRALLAAANATAGSSALPAPVAAAVPAPTPPVRLRVDPGVDPATLMANLTAAGIQLAVSY
jgi:hypothetical protein